MKKAAFLVITAVLVAISLPAIAQDEFPDVPQGHWAYSAVQELANAGIIQGYPDGTFGGKRALTRYEFAEALAKAIPVISGMAGGGPGAPGERGPAGAPGPAGPPGTPGITPEELQALRGLINEFEADLKEMGEDVDALRRDVDALAERVSALEAEVSRVKITADINLIGRGEVDNTGNAIDRDDRSLGDLSPTDPDNPLANSEAFVDADLKIKGRVSDNATANVVINTGDYLPFAISGVDDFTLWNLNLDAGIRLGPLGATQLVVGRFPFQLTPLTFKFVDPDSYTYVEKLDAGDFILDGARASFNLGRVALTAFAAKTDDQIADLISPDLLLGAAGVEVSQVGGARAVIGTPFGGNLGLTYAQLGLAPGSGRNVVMGADLNATIAGLGLMAEFAETDPNDAMETALGAALDDDNSAWNAKLSWQAGKLALAGGFTTVETNYDAPGYWSRLGRAVNLTNVEGPTANLSYALTPRVSLSAEGQFLQPDDDAAAVAGRTSTTQGRTVSVAGASLDKITYWRAGLKYGLTAANTVDLGWEQVSWEPVTGSDTEERYISIGVGHSFNANSSLKLLYQIVEYEQGALTPYSSPTTDARGGVATAQFNVKF